MSVQRVNIKTSINKRSIQIENGLKIRLAHNIAGFLIKYSFKGSGILRRLVSKLLLSPIPKSSIICLTNYGFKMIVEPSIDKGLERVIYFNGIYEAGTISIMKGCLKQGDTFIDVGSNIGLMSLSASQFVGNNGHVYSFEPEPTIFAILTQNIKINKIDNVYAYNFALGQIKKKAIVYSNLDISRGSASLIKPIQKNSNGKEVLVETLDKVVTINNITNIKMIKIDVEGCELEVLKGANHILGGPNAPIICVEYSKLHQIENGQLLDIYNYILSVNNYKIYKLKKGKEIPSKLIRIADVVDLPPHDNLFCFLPNHLESIQK